MIGLTLRGGSYVEVDSGGDLMLDLVNQQACVYIHKDDLPSLFKLLKAHLEALDVTSCCHKTRLKGAPCPIGRDCPYLEPAMRVSGGSK